MRGDRILPACDPTDVEAPEESGIRRGRLEGISDGIMAVAITLLALGIDAPIPQNGESLLQAFDAQTLGAIGLFALSFFLIARFWLVHHRLFAGLPSTLQTDFVVLNFAFLAVICLVPFATTTYSRNPDDMTALMIYTAVVAGATILLSVMFHRSAVSNRRRSLVVPIILLSAVPIGLIVGPRYAPIVWILLFFADAARFRRPS